MDTIVGLVEVVASLGLDLVFRVQEEKRVAITSGQNVRDALPKPSNAIIQQTRPKVQGQEFNTVTMCQLSGGREHLRRWQILPLVNINKKQIMMAT
jgi:hypothetical protein